MFPELSSVSAICSVKDVKVSLSAGLRRNLAWWRGAARAKEINGLGAGVHSTEWPPSSLFMERSIKSIYKKEGNKHFQQLAEESFNVCSGIFVLHLPSVNILGLKDV